MHAPPPRSLLLAAALGLFLVWSNTFLAFEVLLAPRTGPAPLDWFGLTVARYVPVAVVGAAWCGLVRRRESIALVREHPWRLLAGGALVVPLYNTFMYQGMQARVAGPIASLVTSLAPLYLVVLGTAFLGERLTARKVAGLALGLGGVVAVATAKTASGAHWGRVAEVALAPLSWSIYSALTKPVLRRHSAIVWTYMTLVAGTLLVLPAIPFLGAPDVAALDAKALWLLAYLAFAATVLANAVWSWILRHLPASTAGLTVFLNPPLTLVSKFGVAAVFPASFAVTITGQEWAGGAVMLAGVALAVLPGRAAAPRPATAT
jgi:drug/metabolite transporter (DMT)-like permease